jgi:hypothetical protein
MFRHRPSFGAISCHVGLSVLMRPSLSAQFLVMLVPPALGSWLEERIS